MRGVVRRNRTWPTADDMVGGTRARELADARKVPRTGDPATRGKCRACGELVAYADAADHAAGHWGGEGTGAYLVLVESRERREFWMLARAARGAYLSDIDRRLRRSWLDCHYDHICMMVVDDVAYDGGVVLGEHDPEEPYLRMEDYTVEEVLGAGDICEYTYDLVPHRSTYLDIKVVSQCPVSGMERPVEVAMRNEQVERDCTECGLGGAGRYICIECSSLANDRFMCGTCAPHHRHGGDRRILPVRNSPRMGRCMYGKSRRTDTTPWPPSHAWGMRYEIGYPFPTGLKGAGATPPAARIGMRDGLL